MIPLGTTNAGNLNVDNMRYLEGKIGYYAPDGTNCMRTIGIALKGTPFEGEINVDQAIVTGGEYGLLRDPGKYMPKPGDLAIVNNGYHAVMVTESGGTIQNGESHEGVWESSESPAEMFGNVDCYIETSVFSRGLQKGLYPLPNREEKRPQKPNYNRSSLKFSFETPKDKNEKRAVSRIKEKPLQKSPNPQNFQPKGKDDKLKGFALFSIFEKDEDTMKKS